MGITMGLEELSNNTFIKESMKLRVCMTLRVDLGGVRMNMIKVHYREILKD